MVANNPPQNSLLNALPLAVFEKLLPHLELVTTLRGEVLYQSGSMIRYVYFPATCVVSLLYDLENGTSSEIAVIGNEGMLGIELFTGGETSVNRAVVQSPGTVFRLQSRLFSKQMLNQSSFYPLLLQYTQTLLTQISQTAVCNRHHSIEQQLCRWLLIIMDKLPNDELDMTHELMAHNLGVRRESVTQAARKLQQAGMINYTRGHISVLNRAKLEQQVCECYKVVKHEFDNLLLYQQAYKLSMRLTQLRVNTDRQRRIKSIISYPN